MGRGLAGRILEEIRRRQEDSDLQMYATEPPGAIGEEEWITVEQMEEVCPECAGNMRDRNMTRIAAKEAIECGLVEYVDAGQHQDVPAGDLGEEKKDGWPRKLKKGRFSEYCRREGFSGPGIECARKAMDSDDASVRGMASFYMNTVQPGGKTAAAVGGEKECGPTPDDEG